MQRPTGREEEGAAGVIRGAEPQQQQQQGQRPPILVAMAARQSRQQEGKHHFLLLSRLSPSPSHVGGGVGFLRPRALAAAATCLALAAALLFGKSISQQRGHRGQWQGLEEEEDRCTVPRRHLLSPEQQDDEGSLLLGPMSHPIIFVLPPSNHSGSRSIGTSRRNEAFRSLTAFHSLVEQYGHLPVILTSSNSYSQGRREGTLGDYLLAHQHQLLPLRPPETGSPLCGGDVSNRSRCQGGGRGGAAANESFYLFGNHHGPEWEAFLDNYEQPPCRTCHTTTRSGQHQAPDGGHSSSKGDDVALSFGVGWSGSGVSWHVHGPGYSEVLWGRKRWLLYPPSSAPPYGFHPNASTAQWLASVLPGLPLEQRPLDCVIGPGEALYFPPMWWHATLNLDPYTAFTSTFTHE